LRTDGGDIHNYQFNAKLFILIQSAKKQLNKSKQSDLLPMKWAIFKVSQAQGDRPLVSTYVGKLLRRKGGLQIPLLAAAELQIRPNRDYLVHPFSLIGRAGVGLLF